jgi:hypothetical protein
MNCKLDNLVGRTKGAPNPNTGTKGPYKKRVKIKIPTHGNVRWIKGLDKWIPWIKHDGQTYRLGSYNAEPTAIKAYNLAVKAIQDGHFKQHIDVVRRWC